MVGIKLLLVRCASGRDQGHAQGGARSIQIDCVGGPIWNGRRLPLRSIGKGKTRLFAKPAGALEVFGNLQS
jgi:hypothetical protein